MAEDENLLPSSPDPLALSNENIPTPSPIKSKGPIITPRKPLTSISGNTRVQDFFISTPPSKRSSRSPTKNSQDKTPTSPWQIRLTLQAEQVADHVAGRRRKNSPEKRVTENVTTITVPLKGGDDSPLAASRRGRGRPRKSLEGPRKRDATPRAKSNGRRKTLPEGMEGCNDSTGPAINLSPKKNRRRRKSVDLKSNCAQDLVADDAGCVIDEEETASEVLMEKPVEVSKRGRRKEITPMRLTRNPISAPSQETPDGEEEACLDPQNEIGIQPQAGSFNLTMPFGLIQEESQSVKYVGHTPHKDTMPFDAEPKATPSVDNEKSQEIANFDPTDEHIEYDTILESEGFSMVSVSSLASSSAHLRNTPTSTPNNHGHTPEVASPPSLPPALQTDPAPSSSRHLTQPQDGTPKLARVIRAGIALQGVLSRRNHAPRLGSPFQERKNNSSPIAHASGASHENKSSLKARSASPKARLDELFGCFGADTRRELRAGLWLGEELAKRNREASQKPVSNIQKDEDVFGWAASPKHHQTSIPESRPAYSLTVPERIIGSEEVQYPFLPRIQLPTPERSDSEADEDRMSWKESTPIKTEQVDTPMKPYSSSPEQNRESSGIDHTQLALEAEWQREREAVSRQIEMANKSQVIVIDSDSDDGDGQETDQSIADEYAEIDETRNDLGDIWQAEAQSVESSQDPIQEESPVSLPAAITKPRRSKLPSPWRRHSEVSYSEQDPVSDADLFWEPNHAQQKAKPSTRRSSPKPRVIDAICELKEEPSDNSQHEDQESQQLDESKATQEIEQQDESTDALIACQLNTIRIKEPDRVTAQKIERTHSSSKISTSSCDESHGQDTTQEKSKASVINSYLDNEDKDHGAEMPRNTTVASSNNTDNFKSCQQKTVQDESLQIDPFLLQPRKPPSQNPKQPAKDKPGPRPPLQLNPTNDQSSWLSLLTRPLTTFLSPSPSAPSIPPATKTDLLLSSHPEPLSLLTPWTPAHTRALGPLYYSALLYPLGILPYNPSSPAAKYLGATVATHLDWSRRIGQLDCAVADAFIVVLEERGYNPSTTTAPAAAARKGKAQQKPERIDAGVAVRMCVELWSQMCMRGEVVPDASKGEKSGMRRGGDVKWSRARDVKWEECKTEYFERKRREFDGLPSWKEKGLVWRDGAVRDI
ncbi:hypothetical protein ACLMJK_007566 [Lecanora helva]